MSELSDRFNALAGKIESENASPGQVADFLRGLVDVARIVGPIALSSIPGAGPLVPVVTSILSTIDNAAQSHAIRKSDLTAMARAAADLVAAKKA